MRASDVDVRVWEERTAEFFHLIGPLLFDRTLQRDLPYLRLRPECAWILASAGGIAVGLAAIHVGGARATLHHVWVADAWRGRGIGAQIVERSARYVGERAQLLTLTAGAGAVGYFRRLGFIEKSRRGSFTTMERRLA